MQHGIPMIFRINCNNHIYEFPLSDAIKVMWIVPFMSHVAASAILSPKRSVTEKPQGNDTGAQVNSMPLSDMQTGHLDTSRMACQTHARFHCKVVPFPSKRL